MKSHDAGLDRIKELLREHPKGMKVTQIAAAIGMNRNSVAKYLDILLITHQVEMLPHGMSKIYRLSRRTGIPTVLDASLDLIVMLDTSLRVVQVNDNYLAFAGVTREAVAGIPLSSPVLPGVNLPAVIARVPEALRGETVRTEIRETREGCEYFFSVRIAPSVLADGRSGVILVFEDITDKKKNEEVLKASEADFRTLFGASSAGMAVCNAGGWLLETNAAFLDIFRVTTQNEIGFLNILAFPGMPAGSLDVLKNGKNVMFESILDLDQLRVQHRYFPKSAGRTTLEVTLAPISLAKEGWQAGYLAQVRESDVRIRNIMEQVPDFVARFSPDLRYLSANHGMETVAGIRPEACIGRTNHDLGLPPDQADLLDRRIREVFRTAKAVSFPFSGGREGRPYQVNLAPEIGKSGEVVSVIAVTRDTAPVREPVPDESQKLLEEILACIDEAVVLIDSRTGTLSFANPIARQIYGYRKGEALAGAPDIPGHSREMKEAFAGAGYHEMESQVRGVDGRNRRVTQHLRPVYNDKGELRHIVMIIRDMAVTNGSSQGFSLPLRTFSKSNRNTSGGF
jgi:PAS domain S-box-containing protein